MGATAFGAPAMGTAAPDAATCHATTGARGSPACGPGRRRTRCLGTKPGGGDTQGFAGAQARQPGCGEPLTRTRYGRLTPPASWPKAEPPTLGGNVSS
jgi:hypothetical protein